MLSIALLEFSDRLPLAARLRRHKTPATGLKPRA
jgi:hypothetical protein